MTKQQCLRVYALQLSAFFPSQILPQAIGSLLSYVMQNKKINENFKVCGVFWKNETADDIISRVRDPQVLLASSYVWNWKRTYEVIQKIKMLYPSCQVIIGGPEPRYDIEWMREHPEIDILVPYYGEVTLEKILLRRLEDQDYSKVPGIITKKFHNKNYQFSLPEEMPSPYLNGFFDKLIEKGTAECLRAIFETNRGCPYSCTFCDIGSDIYKKVQTFDMERCLSELEWMIKNKVETIDVADANFGIFPRDEHFVDHLIKLKEQYKWEGRFLPTWNKSGSSRITLLAKKILNNNLDSVFGISLQSLNPKVLDNIKRKNAFSLDDLNNINEEMSRTNVNTYTELIFPLPGVTLDSFVQDISTIVDMENSFDKLQINQLSYISNSEISDSNSSWKIEWKKIKGFTRHYYGLNCEDIIAVSNMSISEKEVFEGLFYVKCFIIPFYYYGIVKRFADHLHTHNIRRRSELLSDIYQRFRTDDELRTFKEQQYNHYFLAISGKVEFGQSLSSKQNYYYPEYAIAHNYFISIDIFQKLKKWYPQYIELITFDECSLWRNRLENIEFTFNELFQEKWLFSEDREMSNDEYLEEIYINGRFDHRWQKNLICRYEK